ncbi:MAG: COG3942 and LysM peptidoglycan-binding domain-containing protein [Candidatus Dormibacteria bacterium]
MSIVLPLALQVAQPSLHQEDPFLANAQAASVTLAGNVRLDAGNVIAKRPSIPGESQLHREAFYYDVQDGETLSGIAVKFGVSMDTLRWANASIVDIDQLQMGQQLVIPPTDGVWVGVKPGDTLSSLAAQFHVDPQKVIEYNYLRDPEHLQAGVGLMIPDGRGPDYVPPAPAPVVDDTAVTGGYGSRTTGGYSRYHQPIGSAAWRFPWGYCTWYVATRRFVPWSGDAWEWYGNAQAMGYATGHRPEPGAIMVSWESPIGHVAYVESVHSDGSFTISEMNYAGFGMVDYRTVYPGQFTIIGFIY